MSTGAGVTNMLIGGKDANANAITFLLTARGG